MSKKYFKGLDGLRGIAAIAVVLGHIELIKKANNIQNVYDGGGPFFLYLGSYAVTFFFVLSGFLITFLLLKEKEQKNYISIKSFYIRRILRIWPVYYILFILGFLILPNLSFNEVLLPNNIDNKFYWKSFFLNLVLLPNFSPVSNPVAFQSWSIGVEEQFYIFWPLLVHKIKTIKKLFIAMLTIIIGLYVLRSGMYLNSIFDLKIPFLNTFNSFFAVSRFDNMAIGGILAIVFYKYPNFKFSNLQKTLLGFCAGFILYKQKSIGFGLDNIIAAIIFGGIIFWVVKKQEFVFLSHPIFLFLGKISYGIYMYHVIGIYVTLNLVISFFPKLNPSQLEFNLLVYCSSILTTVLISYFSYYLIEKKILQFKEYFT